METIIGKIFKLAQEAHILLKKERPKLPRFVIRDNLGFEERVWRDFIRAMVIDNENN